MPLPLIPLAIGGAQALPKLYQAIVQNDAAGKVKLQDSTTNAEREQLGMSRQAANSARLPGFGYQQNRLGRLQGATLQNARLGAGSGADFLAAGAGAAAQRQQGELQLGAQGLQYQDRARQQLRQDLTVASARQQRDLDNYNREKAALTQGAAENLNNAVGGAASYAALAYNAAESEKDRAAYGTLPAARGSGSFGVPSMQYGAEAENVFAPGTTTPAKLGIPQLPSLPTVPNYGLSGYGANRYRFGLGGGRYANRQQRYGF